MYCDVLNASQVAQLLGIDEQQVIRYAFQKKMPGRLVGGYWRFSKMAVESWAKNQVEVSSPQKQAR